MLPENTIKAIKEDGLYFIGELEKNLKQMDPDVVEWFVENYRIEKRDSSFIDFYNCVTIPPAGNGAYLFSLDEIKEFNNIKERVLVFAYDEIGLYIYDKFFDRVYDIDPDKVYEIEKNPLYLNGDRKNLKKFVLNQWSSFSNFLEDYYSNNEHYEFTENI